MYWYVHQHIAEILINEYKIYGQKQSISFLKFICQMTFMKVYPFSSIHEMYSKHLSKPLMNTSLSKMQLTTSAFGAARPADQYALYSYMYLTLFAWEAVQRLFMCSPLPQNSYICAQIIEHWLRSCSHLNQIVSAYMIQLSFIGNMSWNLFSGDA